MQVIWHYLVRITVNEFISQIKNENVQNFPAVGSGA